ncbi:hypothetical protein [Geothrix paludis]|uniref:hypothetical protein n=1 Tax=Geothrix paludis TaxID=2922722 RepID=UPI001FAC8318|nr:hypothetical protein [Geothrix paludis]
MRIKGKSIRSLTKVLPMIGDGRCFYVGLPVSGNESRLIEIGFPKKVQEGQSILPAVLGRHTDFNANGREIIRMDLPLVPESRMVYSTWNDWHGYPHSGFQHRTFNVRQRDLVDPPEENFTVVQNTEGIFTASRELCSGRDSDEQILHVINLFLECFGECHLLDEKKGPIIKVNRLNWHVLPKGEYPWANAKEHIEKVTLRLKDGDREVIEHRLKHIAKHTPDFLAIGQGGFDGYFVLGFSNKNLFVLESPHLDNATYVLSSNWKELSQLTKKEILKGSLQHKRLIHNKGWYRGLTTTLAARKG